MPAKSARTISQTALNAQVVRHAQYARVGILVHSVKYVILSGTILIVANFHLCVFVVLINVKYAAVLLIDVMSACLGLSLQIASVVQVALLA